LDWSEQWKWRWWKLLWYRGMGGYSEADEYDNRKNLERDEINQSVNLLKAKGLYSILRPGLVRVLH